MKNQRTILLSGGGSGGPVAPLLALVDEWRRQDYHYRFIWVGTKNGPERQMAKEYGISLSYLPEAKLRRYFSLKNIFDIFKLIGAFLKSLLLILKYRPQLVSSAGGFNSVPLVWAAFLLRVPVHIHQQDVRPGLANKLMAPFARLITVTFSNSVKDYKSAVHTGNPVRSFFKTVNENSPEEYKRQIGLGPDKPILTVIGGGTGSRFLNDFIAEKIRDLLDFCQIIHISGSSGRVKALPHDSHYIHFEFVEGGKIAKILAVSDLVLSRAGLGLITELAFLKKPAIFIPIPNSHQEDNAQLLQDRQAAIILDQDAVRFEELVKIVKLAIKEYDIGKIKNFSRLIPRQAEEKIIKEIEKIWK